jgi:D-aspartate ligase
VHGAHTPPAILLGGEQIAVSAARSLAERGVEIYALGAASDPVRHSRACAHFADVGSKEGVEQRFMEWLETGPRGAVVLPCYDDGLETVIRHRPQLTEWGYRLPEGADDVALTMLDKVRTYELVSGAGLPVPRTAPLRVGDDARRTADDFTFPCALKPIHSHLFKRHFRGTKLFVVRDAEELLDRFEQLEALGIDMMLTELVPGGDDRIHTYYTYVADDGQPLYHFTKRKIRQWPVRFGLACYQVTTWDPDVAEAGLRFCERMGLRGIATIEFKRDPRDGRLMLIECNPRLTGSNELTRHCGLEIAQVAYCRAAGLKPPVIRGYRTGVHEWYPIEDVRAMLAYRRDGELTASAWARSLLHRQHFPMLRGSDPMPSLTFFADRVRGAPAKLLTRARAS